MTAGIAYFIFILCLFGILQLGIPGIIISIVLIIACLYASKNKQKKQMQSELEVEKELVCDEWDIANISIKSHENYLNNTKENK